MKKWKLTLLASASGVVLAGSAFAADLPRKGPAPIVAPIPYVDWTGGYIGGLIGVGTSTSVCNSQNFGSGGIGCQDFQQVTAVMKDTSAVAGVEIGYDWQNCNFVYGVAADWTWTGMKRTLVGVSGSMSWQAKINWLASFRGRAGLAIDNTLVYLTGGLALAGIKDIFGEPQTVVLSTSSTRVGWVAGAGVEHRFTPNWSVKFEYLHYEFNNKTLDGIIESSDANHFTLDHSVDVARVGFAYRFGGRQF